MYSLYTMCTICLRSGRKRRQRNDGTRGSNGNWNLCGEEAIGDEILGKQSGLVPSGGLDLKSLGLPSTIVGKIVCGYGRWIGSSPNPDSKKPTRGRSDASETEGQRGVHYG
jgi:hypothetical protein